jgi:hypothetical protein
MASVDQGAHYSRERMLDALGDLLYRSLSDYRGLVIECRDKYHEVKQGGGADWSEVRELEAMEQGRLNAILVTVTKIINEGKRVKS